MRYYNPIIAGSYEITKHYDIKKTTDNRSEFVIKEDILKDANKKNWVNVVKKRSPR